jgi:hypothetical protein
MAIIKPKQLSSEFYTISGSFSGSFHGDGSDLLNVPLDSKIVTGSISAEVNIDDIFLIKSGSTEFLKIDNLGSTTIQNDAPTLFLVRDLNNVEMLKVDNNKVITLATHSTELTSSAPNGGIYFTSSSLFIGLG